MFYAHTQHTPIPNDTLPLFPIDGTKSSILSDIRVKFIDLGWLLISSSTGYWCILNDKEYKIFQRIVYSSESTGLPDRVNLTEHEKVLASHLYQRGLLRTCKANRPGNSSPEFDLFSLTLLLSNRCNLACKYCYLGIQPEQKLAKLTIQTANRAIKDAFYYAPRSILIDFGEITVNFQLFQDLVLYAEELSRKYPNKSLLMAIQTNGTSLKPKIVDFLEKHRIIVGISLDGPEGVNDLVRQFPSGRGSYQQIESGLKEIIKRKIEHIVLCTVSAANIEFTDEILDYFLSLDVSHFSFKPVIRKGSAKFRWDSLGISVQQFVDFLDRAIEYVIFTQNWNALDDRFVKFIFRALKDPRGWSDRCPTTECGCGTQMLVLNPEGGFYPCPRFSANEEDDLCLGHNLRQAVEKSFVAKSFDFVPSQCEACIWWPFCKGGCSLAYQRNNSMMENLDPYCEIYQRMYNLIFSKILPTIGLTNSYGGRKLGNIEIIDQQIFP